MNVVYSVIFAILLTINIQTAHAEDAVMIIRFNEEIVNYKKPLGKVINSTLEAKSNAFFDVVSVVPTTDSSRQNRANKAESISNSNNVVDVLLENRVGTDNIRITFQDSDIVGNNEVHIFVR